MIAIDSNRTKDEEFGYLTVENCVLTGSDVAKYYGREIPGFKDFGLDPEKIYDVYRPEKEIKNSDFTYKPLLSNHADFSSEDYKSKMIVGTVGETDMKGEKLLGTVVFWDKKAIDELEKGKKFLSCGYLYTPILEKGFFKNSRYDIKMTNIVANHVAMVDNPRYKAALVADGDSTISKKGNILMFFTKKKNVEAKTYTFDQAIEDIKTILVSDEAESLKEKAVSEVKKKLGEDKMSKDKMIKDKMIKDKKDAEMKKKEDDEEMECADDEGMESEEEGEYGEGAEDEDLENEHQEEEEKKEKSFAGDKKKMSKDKMKMGKDGKKMTGDSAYIKKLVADSVSVEIEKLQKRTMAFDSAIKEYERTCGRVNKLAFDSATKVLNTILKNHGKNFENKSFEQKQAMVEMLPNANRQSTQTLTVDNSTVKNHTPENILKFLKRG